MEIGTLSAIAALTCLFGALAAMRVVIRSDGNIYLAAIAVVLAVAATFPIPFASPPELQVIMLFAGAGISLAYSAALAFSHRNAA